MKQSSNILEQQEQIKITFTRKSKADWIRGRLATIPFRIFCFPVTSV